MFDKLQTLTKEIWRLILLTGIASAIFGLVTLLWPTVTLKTLVYILAIFILVGGGIGLFQAVSRIKLDPLWWLALLFSFVNMGIGVFLLRNPEVTAAFLAILLAVVIFARAIFDFVVATYMGNQKGRWVWIAIGVLGLVAGTAILFYPGAASLAFTWVLGLYALIHGVATIAFAFGSKQEVRKIG